MSDRRPRWIPRYASPATCVLVALSMTLVIITQLLRLVAGELGGWEDLLCALSVLLWAYAAAVLLALRRHPEWIRRPQQ